MSDDQIEYLDADGNPIDPADLDGYEVVEEGGDDDTVETDELGFDEADVYDDEAPDVAPVREQSAVPVRQSAPAPVDDDGDLDDIVVDDAPTPTPSMADATAFAAGPAEVVPDIPQEAGAPTLNRRAKMLLAGGAVAAVAVIGGGIAFALAGIGGQHTVDDVKAAGQSKYAQASSSVVAKSSEVRGDAAAVVIDACRAGKLSGPGGLGAAMATGAEAPKLRLDVISSVPLPGAFISAAGANADGVSGKVSLLQLTRTGWGVYTTTPLTRAERKNDVARPGFHKADVVVDDTSIRVTGDRVWAGGDTGGAGSCEPGEPGVYAATGKIPADAAGLVDGQASVTAIQGIAGDATKAVAVMGNSVVLVRLAEAPAEGGDASASSSSVVPSR